MHDTVTIKGEDFTRVYGKFALLGQLNPKYGRCQVRAILHAVDNMTAEAFGKFMQSEQPVCQHCAKNWYFPQFALLWGEERNKIALIYPNGGFEVISVGLRSDLAFTDE